MGRGLRPRTLGNHFLNVLPHPYPVLESKPQTQRCSGQIHSFVQPLQWARQGAVFQRHHSEQDRQGPALVKLALIRRDGIT